MIRLFIAVEIPKEVKEEISRYQRYFNKIKKIKWVKKKNIHITLKFLGNVEEERVKDIVEAMEETANKNSGFRIELQSLGAFPKTKSARVIWIGIEDRGNNLKGLAGDLDQNLSAKGFQKESRDFKAHLTIARMKLISDLRSHIDKIEEEPHFKDIPVNKIVLFKSTLRPEGPLYEALEEIPLRD